MAHLSCPSFADHFWNLVYSELGTSEDSFTLEKNFDGEGSMAQLLSELDSFRFWLRRDLVAEAGIHDPNEALAFLTSLEMGATDSRLKAQAQKIIKLRFARIRELTGAAGILCGTAEPEMKTAWPEPHPLALPGTTAGARYALMTAYQSCNSLDEPVVTARTPDARGISVVGTHPDGVGSKRRITDLNLLNRSHHYLVGRRSPSRSCLDVHKKPLIYDYGGKPRARTSLESDLNLFSDAGTGSTELGIDCSGNVYTALASQGLKFRKQGRLKAAGVFGVSARMMSNPKAHGLDCLEQIPLTPSSTLRQGDIIAGRGHVAIVDRSSRDPFGLGWISRKDQCRSENINTRTFDFDVLHSSSDKNGTGINRMRGFEFFENHSEMKPAIIATAVRACRARFGEISRAHLPDASIVRHVGGSACRDRPIALTHSQCIQNCSLHQ